MYHFPEQVYHHNNAYQHTPFKDPIKNQSVTTSTTNTDNQFEPAISIHVGNVNIESTPKKPEAPVETKREKNNKKRKRQPSDKANVDTSNYSIEERLVAAVWVHERKRTRSSMRQIRQDFRYRFGREPPTKNTLMVWERKLFSTGSVCDAPRSGRPANRLSRAEEVAASNLPSSVSRCSNVGEGDRESAADTHQLKPKIKELLTKSSPLPTAGATSQTPHHLAHISSVTHTDGYT